MAKWGSLMFITKLFLLLNYFSTVSLGDSSSDFRAFYFIQKWLPSYCNQKGTPCCYPPAGKPPPNFTIYGLWPFKDDGSAIQNCPGATFDVAPLKPIQDMLQEKWPTFTCPLIGRKFWLHEWNKHGTCSKSALGQMPYFKAAMDLNDKLTILQALANAGIKADNQAYPLDKVVSAIANSFGFQPILFCNHDAQGNSQLWQVVHCVDKTGVNLINCTTSSGPLKGHLNCGSTVKFPSYY